MKAEQGCQRQVNSAAARVGCVWKGNEAKTKKSYQLKWTRGFKISITRAAINDDFRCDIFSNYPHSFSLQIVFFLSVHLSKAPKIFN